MMLHTGFTGAHMRVLHFAVSLAGLVALRSQLALAQAPDTLSAARRAGWALARLGAGQRVRIVTRASEFVEGSVVTTSPTLLSVRTAESVVDIPTSGVDSLWVRGGSHAGTGALIGAVPGVLVLGATFVYSQIAPAGETRDLNSFGGAISGLFLLGVGTAIGAIVGAHTPKWELRVPSRAEQYRQRFVEGPVLVLPTTGEIQYTRYFSVHYPDTVVPIDSQSTVYGTLHIRDVWGELHVTNGALIILGSSGRVDRVQVPAPPAAGILEGDGWKLQLNPEWQIVSGDRSGDFTLARNSTP
ncbi:MAG TPA: hypothetical protein VNA31_09270 [bacterium]|nr:hypothetical protein [bacterium]